MHKTRDLGRDPAQCGSRPERWHVVDTESSATVALLERLCDELERIACWYGRYAWAVGTIAQTGGLWMFTASTEPLPTKVVADFQIATGALLLPAGRCGHLSAWVATGAPCKAIETTERMTHAQLTE